MMIDKKRLLQNYLPQPRLVEMNRIFVKAKPEKAWAIVRHFELSSVFWIRWLFGIRMALSKLKGGNVQNENGGLNIDEFTREGSGFMILQEIPGEDVVVGSIGQFWHFYIPFAQVTPKQFRNFNKHGWGKLAWAISLKPFKGGSTISIELRVTATDPESWKKFRRYYAIIGVGSQLIRNAMMAKLKSELGEMTISGKAEIALPGDTFIPEAKYALNHSIIIESPPAIVWRYIMQLGCDRAGWYSIDALDNKGIPSVDHLVKGWETRTVGDKIALTPAKDSFYDVYEVQPEKFLLIGHKFTLLRTHVNMTWSFVLEPIGGDASKLSTRVRGAAYPKFNAWLFGRIIAPPIHAIMQKVQLKTIKRLAERDALAR